MKLNLEIELEHVDGPRLSLLRVAEFFRDDMEGSTIWVESDADDESSYEVKSVKLFN